MSHEIPQVVIYQAVNFLLFALLLFVLLKKQVVSHFSTRRKDYIEAVSKYEKAKAEAEEKTAALYLRMEGLETSANQSIQRAKTEAAALQSSIVSEAQEASQKLQQDTKRTVDAEVARAVRELRAEVLKQATEAARQQMQQQIKEQDQQRLQREFVEKIQVAQQ